ncbi:MAG: hypothetical protein GC131_08670 [Alphaproteobacteria bacterium]|nr:hypothetical protein [Alphaproteobacteria bacterium]
MIRRLFPLLALFVLLFSAAPALAQSNSCTLVTTGTSQDITAFTTCKRVTNSSGTTVCAVSNVDSAQWASFYNNPPSGVTIGECSCTLPWGGTINNGQGVTAYQASSVACGASCVSQTRTCTSGVLSGTYTNASCSVATCAGWCSSGVCYYQASSGQSCNTFCGSHGGCDATGVSGMGGNWTTCGTVGAHFGATAATNGVDCSSLGAMGCMYYTYYGTSYYRCTQGGTCDATPASVYVRFCACNS